MRYVITKDLKIYDLESKKISSWEYIDKDTAQKEYGCEDAVYNVYYYNREEGCYLECDDKGGQSMDSFYVNDILKSGDIVDELCDEYVIVDLLENEKPILIIKSVIREMMRRTTNIQIYGAIWTSKGLIFVSEYDKEKDEMILYEQI